MSGKKASVDANLSGTGLIIEALTMTAAQLIDNGYIKLDGKQLEQFAPVINIIQTLGAQNLVGNSSNESLKKILESAYICKVDGKAVADNVLTKVKGSSSQFRGIVHGEKGISKHATLEKIDPQQMTEALGKATAPEVVAIVFMAMSIATSQYYLHEMNGNYVTICSEIKTIKEQFMIQDDSEIIAGQKTIAKMVNHFDSIMESDNRRQSESINAGKIEFDALKQIERSKLKLEKGFVCDSKKDSVEQVENNVNGIINTLAQLKTAVYVYGMAKGLKVCFDGVESQEEITVFINEIKEQIEQYKETVKKTTETLNSYVTDSRELDTKSKEQVGGIAAASIIAGPFAPAVAGFSVYRAKSMKDKRGEQMDGLEKVIKDNTTLDDVDSLSKSVEFLENYASSFDSELEIVSCDSEYYIRTKKK